MGFIAYDPIYKLDLPEGHRFPMEKYELLPLQLLYEGVVNENSFFSPIPLSFETAALVHTEDYLGSLLDLSLDPKIVRKIGFPLSNVLIEREFKICGGSLMAAKIALEEGLTFNIAGGTHHAYKNSGEGFCILNDVAIAATALIKEKLVNKVLVVDLDVHQGNGTAKIFQDVKKVFTFSMHCEANYPFKKEKSDLDIGLKTKISGNEYLKILKDILPKLINQEQPDFIFYVAGVDVLASDKLGKLDLSVIDCQERDFIVFSEAKKREIPVMVSMAGGYSADINTIVNAHCNTFKAGIHTYY